MTAANQLFEGVHSADVYVAESFLNYLKAFGVFLF